MEIQKNTKHISEWRYKKLQKIPVNGNAIIKLSLKHNQKKITKINL